MKTEDLVSLLSTGAQAVDLRRASRRWLLALAGGALMAFLLTAGLLKLNPVLWHETYKPMFWVRESYCAVLGVLGFITVVRLARPGLRLGLAPMGIPVAVIAMWVLAVVTLVAASPQNRALLILGHTAAVCPFLGHAEPCPDAAALGGCRERVHGRIPRRARIYPALPRAGGTVSRHLVP